MNKAAVSLTLLCALYAVSPLPTTMAQTQVAKDALMSDAEYRVILNQIDASLPEWERALRSIDPEKMNLSYTLGKDVVRDRDIGLMGITNARQLLQKERLHRKVSQELALKGFLQGVFDSMQSILWEAPNVKAPLERYPEEMGKLIGKVANDVQARVELLEKGTCP